MKLFSNMRIGSRLGLGFGALLLLMMVVAWLGFSRIQEIQGRLEETISSTMVKIKLPNTMRHSVRASAAAALNKLVTRDAGKALIGKMAEARQRSGPLIDQVLALAKEQKNAEGTALWRAELHPEELKWQLALEEMVQLQDTFAAADAGSARRLPKHHPAAAPHGAGRCAWRRHCLCDHPSDYQADQPRHGNHACGGGRRLVDRDRSRR